MSETGRDNISDAEYSEVMRKSYIDYAMSVIVSRALPDIRDGFKPVHRRILYDMAELGAVSDKPYRKSARIVGDTMGKYHPHGDSSIYDALVVMSQDFKKGRKLIDGHGNFGSIEGDGAAAMRYTEARLDRFAEQVFLDGLKCDMADFLPNFDETEKEPEILPARLPNFLINGSEGIAVGMATNSPPHNISEVADAAAYYLDHPDADTKELMRLLPGPDFPTGGIVVNKKDLVQIYESGTGKLRLRGKVAFEKGKGSEKDRLVITEIPYTMIGDGISKFLQAAADLAENRTLPEISDILNQTSKEGIRIVIELKKGSDPEYVEQMLYKKTKLEDTFGVNMLAVHNGKPEVMGLKDCLSAFACFQYEINERKYRHLLGKCMERTEILEGLIRAIDAIDVIVEILRGSKNTKQAKACLVSGDAAGIQFKTKTAAKRAEKLRFTKAQADAILDMRFSRLIGLELDMLEKELLEKQKLITKYERLLSSRTEMKKEIKKDILALKKEFEAPRKTALCDISNVDVAKREEEEVPIVILVDKFHYIHSIDAGVYEKNKESADADYRFVIPATNKQKIAVFCDSNKAHIIKASDIPYGRLRDKGKPLDNICNFNSKAESLMSIIPVVEEAGNAIFASSDGLVKKVCMKEFDVSRKTIDATKLKPYASLAAVLPAKENGQLVISTKKLSFIRFLQSEIPEQKRNAAGTIGIKLQDGDEVMSVSCIMDTAELVSAGNGQIEAGRVKIMKRGGKGTKTRLS